MLPKLWIKVSFYGKMFKNINACIEKLMFLKSIRKAWLIYSQELEAFISVHIPLSISIIMGKTIKTS